MNPMKVMGLCLVLGVNASIVASEQEDKKTTRKRSYSAGPIVEMASFLRCSQGQELHASGELKNSNELKQGGGLDQKSVLYKSSDKIDIPNPSSRLAVKPSPQSLSVGNSPYSPSERRSSSSGGNHIFPFQGDLHKTSGSPLTY